MSVIKGAEKVKELIERGISEGRKVIAIGDPDVDGIFSLKLMCDLLNMLGVTYSYYINSNRVHGFTLSPEALRGYLVIMADFAISRQCVEDLIKNDCLVVSLDHHKIKDTFIEYDNGVVVNNQYDFEPEEDRYLSGAGVVYEIFSEVYPDFVSDLHKAIVGITLLSDVRPLENNKAKYYLRKTYSSTDEYIKYLIDCTMKADFGFGMPKMDRNFIDFTFSPTVNALLRFNKTQEAINLILGGGMSTDVDYRQKQQDLIRKMKNEVEILEMTSLTVLAIDSSKFTEDITSFIGLLCSSFKNIGKSSLIFAYNSGYIKRASFRGKYDDIDYNLEFNKLGVHAEGHKGAFGIKEFYPDSSTWQELDNLVTKLEENHQDTKTVIECRSLASIMLQRGLKIATQNCYVRDMYRTYIKYTGNRVRVTKHTYRKVPFDDNDYLSHREPDDRYNGESYKYELDANGEKVTKYLEYLIDSKKVKSFGVTIEEGLILPILEKGYIQLYLVQKGV